MPPLHPILAHFPIGLVITAALIEVVAWILDKRILHRVAIVNLIVGTVLLIPVILTGLEAEEAVFTLDPEHETLEVHETFAFVSAGLMVLLTIWAILGFRRWEDRAPVFFVMVLLVGAASIGVAGYYGGKLVYTHGIGMNEELRQSATPGIAPMFKGYRCPEHRHLTSRTYGVCPVCGLRMVPILDLPTPKDLKKLQEEAKAKAKEGEEK